MANGTITSGTISPPHGILYPSTVTTSTTMGGGGGGVIGPNSYHDFQRLYEQMNQAESKSSDSTMQIHIQKINNGVLVRDNMKGMPDYIYCKNLEEVSEAVIRIIGQNFLKVNE